MFAKDLEHSIGQCYKRARESRHAFMTTEHLLLALLDNSHARAVLMAVMPISAGWPPTSKASSPNRYRY